MGSGSNANLVGCSEVPDDSTVIVPGHFGYNGIERTVSSIAINAFQDLEKLAHIVFPETLTYMTTCVSNCPNLKDLVIPEGVNWLVEEYPWTWDRVLQLPSSLAPAWFVGYRPGMGSGYKALGNQTKVFWNLPFSAKIMAQIEQNTEPSKQVELFLAMTADHSGDWVSDKYAGVRGFGLWGKDVPATDEAIHEVSVELNRVDRVKKLQCVINLPDFVQLTPEQIALSPQRVTDHQISYSDGVLTIESPTGAAISGNSGTLFTLKLTGADYDLVMSDIMMVTTHDAILAQANDTIRIAPKVVDISDVNDVINQALGLGQESTFSVGDTEFGMVCVNGGTFMMGKDGEYEDFENVYDDVLAPSHQVTLSDFVMGKTEVTQALWSAVMGVEVDNPQDAVFPQTGKSWNEWNEFIKKLNEQTGLEFRMPTEAEWEYAARGGSKSQGCLYSGSDNPNQVAWWIYDPVTDNGAIMPVAGLKPNELGLYDMSGNAWEWCQDWYAPYSAETQVDPTGAASGTNKVIRGGSFKNVWPERVSVVNHARLQPNSKFYTSGNEPVGLRLAGSALPMIYNKQLDYNHDGVIDVVDVNKTINMMLGIK